MKVIVGILTRREATERRDTCACTWVCRLKQYPNIRTVFLVGDDIAEASLHEETLCLPCLDDYNSLAYKTQEFCRWALTQDFDYLFKCDDDTFVNHYRFASFDPEGKDYIGVDPVDHINPKFASGGAGYWLSRRSAEVVAAMDIPPLASRLKVQPSAEDFIVYQALIDAGIKFTQDKRFQAWNQPHRHPHSSNEIITCHYIKPEEMCRMDAMAEEYRKPVPFGYMDRGNHRRFNRILNEQMQVDWMCNMGKNDGPILLQESISVMGDGPHHYALKHKTLALTYLRQLDGYENFCWAVPAYDLDYVPLVNVKKPLDRDPNALYVFGRKSYGYPSGRIFDRAEHVCTYSYRYELEKMAGVIPAVGIGGLAYDKILAQSKYKFAIACENMMAEGYITEKLVDAFMSDTVPIYVGGKLPPFLEECVCRVDDLDPSKAAVQIRGYLDMPDAEYLAKLAIIRDLRFSVEFYDLFSFQSFFNKARLSIDTTQIRSDGHGWN